MLDNYFSGTSPLLMGISPFFIGKLVIMLNNYSNGKITIFIGKITIFDG
jgi:hypothetical protein